MLRGTAWQGNGMGAACYVWIDLKARLWYQRLQNCHVFTSKNWTKEQGHNRHKLHVFIPIGPNTYLSRWSFCLRSFSLCFKEGYCRTCMWVRMLPIHFLKLAGKFWQIPYPTQLPGISRSAAITSTVVQTILVSFNANHAWGLNIWYGQR